MIKLQIPLILKTVLIIIFFFFVNDFYGKRESPALLGA